MNRADYDRYLRLFNERDYASVLEHFAEHFEIRFAGYVFRDRADMLRFYGFFHDHVAEAISLTGFAASDELVAIEARVRLTGVRTLTPEALAAQGLERIVPLQAGQVVEMNQFIHYTLQGGKITKVVCAVVE